VYAVVDDNKGIAVNKEVYTDDVLESLGLVKENLVENRAAEVGNIFTLGTRYTKAHNLTYKNDIGEEIEPIMGCYGIGPGRLMGTVVEVLSDSKGIIWPESIAPFKRLRKNISKTKKNPEKTRRRNANLHQTRV
jgi:prolyl-tRNA synthetase